MATVKFQEPYENFTGRDSARRTPYGNVAFRHNTTPIARTFSRPLQPNTWPQQWSKFVFQLASGQWASLSSSDKDDWQTLADTITRTNAEGFTYHPSARSLYIQSFIQGWRQFLASPPAPVVPWTPNQCLAPTFMQRGSAGGFDGVFLTFLDTIIDGWLAFDFAGPLTPSTRSPKGLTYLFPGWLPLDDPIWGGGPPNFPPSVSTYTVFTNTSAPNPTFFNDIHSTFNFAEGSRWAIRVTPISVANQLPGTPQYSILNIAPP